MDIQLKAGGCDEDNWLEEEKTSLGYYYKAGNKQERCDLIHTHLSHKWWKVGS